MTTGKLWGFGVRDMPERDGLMAEGDDCRFFRSEREGFETYSGSGGSLRVARTQLMACSVKCFSS